MPDGVTAPDDPRPEWRIAAIRARFAEAEPAIVAALPGRVPPHRFKLAVLRAVEANADLTRAEPASVAAAALECARDHLVPDGREAVLFAATDPATGRMVARHRPLPAGVEKLADRGRSLASVTSAVVFEGEPFRVALGDAPHILHTRVRAALREGRPPVAVYAIVTPAAPDGGALTDGNGRALRELEVVPWSEVERVADRDDPMWALWPTEAARLLAIRRLLARLTLHPDDAALARVAGAAAPVAEAAEVAGCAR